MATHSLEFSSPVFVKTDLGRDEIQHRTLRLAPLLRRLLLLVDGARNAQQLAPFVVGQDIEHMLHELTELGCVEPLALPEPHQPAAAPQPTDLRDLTAAAPTSTAAAGSNAVLPADLPPPGSRSPAEVEMARNFMINTINTLLEPNTRLTLVKKIFDSVGAAELREHYPHWDASIGSSWSGARRLPELRKKLFAVL